MSQELNKTFKNRIVYQIYPLSFKDSNNDGYGDLQGIISKLDYLKQLGIGMIWLSPIYESTMKDNGYDIVDYYKINPLFGTMDDFKELIEEAEKRDIKIVMDLVINHTSTEHIWFKEALKDPNSKYRNYYYFRKGKNSKKPPNNWNTSFSGSAREKIDGEDNIYYLHLYTKEQADLNYHNEEVIKEVENILEYYLKMGVYGFRCDVINQIYKTSLKDGKFRLFNRGKEYYESQKENFEILSRFRKVLDKYNAFFVGETSNVTPDVANKFLSTRGLDMFFEFDHSFCDMNKFIPIFRKKFRPKNLINPVLKWQSLVPWIGVYLENHDQRRSVTRYGNEGKYYIESAKALCMFLLTLKGTPFIYQGEEIGMTDCHSFTLNDLDDCLTKSGIKTAKSILHLSDEKLFELANKTINRDNARTPYQWNKSENAGFNEGCKTWLKVNENYTNGINVEDEIKDNNSILNFYIKMINYRNNSEILKFGDFKRIKANKNIAKFERNYNGNKLIVIINLSSKRINNEFDSNKIIFFTDAKITKNILEPYQGIILKE